MKTIETIQEDTHSGRRRKLLGLGGAAVGAALLPELASAAQPAPKRGFPRGFLWGAAVAGHQVEGDNINSDTWVLENVSPTVFSEKSGSACDHYRLFADDIALLASLGLNAFRFSIEWSRVEPEEGLFSVAALEHYREVLEACRKHKIAAVVTFNHFTVPRWFAGRGGWEVEGCAELFARYCDTVARRLGHLMTVATTFNEPNLAQIMFAIPGPMQAIRGSTTERGMIAKAKQMTGTGKFSTTIYGDLEKMEAGMLAAHEAGYKAIKAAAPQLPVGLSMGITDEQAVGDPTMRNRKRAIAYEPWFKAINKHGDFLGVQTYTRCMVGPEGELPPPVGAEMTDSHSEFYPQALEATIRYARENVNLPIYVTENGVAVTDDSRRIAYIEAAVRGVASCLRDGIDVRSYMHWSLLDNFEWNFGYAPKFGLIAVDRQTMRRTVKSSGRRLGGIARANGI